MQKRTHCFNMGIRHAPTPWCTVKQNIGNGNDAHTLVMCHKGIHRNKIFFSRLTRRTVI